MYKYENHEHEHTCENVCTQMYMVCTWYAINVYVHRSHIMLYVHVYRQVYVLILDYINMYVQCTNVYIDCYGAHVECTASLIHFMKCTDIAEPGTYTAEPGTYIAEPQAGTYRMQLFYLSGLLACRLGLAAALCHV